MALGNVHLTGTLKVPADRIEAVLAALPEHIALTRAERGCLVFDVAQSPDDPLCLIVHETFRDQAAFDAHQARNAASSWARITQGMPRHYTQATE